MSKAEEAGIDGDSIDNLQRALGIKDAVAERIGQAVMMESVAKLMKEAEAEGGPKGVTGMHPNLIDA